LQPNQCFFSFLGFKQNGARGLPPLVVNSRVGRLQN
jgi:hypothetical protein